MSDSASILSPCSVTQDSCAKYYHALGISGPARILVMFKRHGDIHLFIACIWSIA